MSKPSFFLDLSAVNSAQSQSFGRRVYCVEKGAIKIWMKAQVADVNVEYERGFCNELNVYEQLKTLASVNQPLLCNFSILDLQCQHPNSDDPPIERYLNTALCVEHANALFSYRSSVLSQTEVFATLQKSLEVLHHLHQLEFIHGDLKVDHFRLMDCAATLIDFEQSCHISEVMHRANTATPRYMAPELFHGQEKSYASDIYALGIIWYEWLMEQKLSAKTYYDWAVLHCQQLKVHVQPEYCAILWVLQKMLAKQKTDRFQTISEIQQALIKG